MSQVANSTAGGQAVYRHDGIRLYGLDAELELKKQAKRDKEYEKKLAHWIEQVIKEKLEFDDIALSLQSGVVLCKLLNAIQPDSVKNINTKPIALMQVENIQLYLKGCWKLGVPTSELFVTSDLHQQKDIPQVMQNLASLARVAQTIPTYKGPTFGLKPSAAPPVKRWESVETNKVVLVTDLEHTQPASSAQKAQEANVCYECGAERKAQARSCHVCRSEYGKQTPPDIGKTIASLKHARTEMEQLATKLKQLEEENKKIHNEKVASDKLVERMLAEKQAAEKKVDQQAAIPEKPAATTAKPSSTASTTTAANFRLSVAVPASNQGQPAAKSNLAASYLKNMSSASSSTPSPASASDSTAPTKSAPVSATPTPVQSSGAQTAQQQEQQKQISQLKQQQLQLEQEKKQLITDLQVANTKLQDQTNKTKILEDKMKRMELHIKAIESKPTVPVATFKKHLVVDAKQNRLSVDLQKRLEVPSLASSGYLDIESGLDPEMLLYTKDCMAQILFSKPIEFADVYALNDLFRTDAGRRRFIQILHSTMKEVSSLVLSDNSFELLLYLVNTVLQQMDISDSKDLRTAKVIMNSANTLSRIVDKTTEYVKDYIKNYSVWKNIDFWVEYFWDDLAKKHRKKYKGNVTELDKSITIDLLGKFGYNMLLWGVNKEDIWNFIRDMAGKNGITQAEYKHMESLVNEQAPEGVADMEKQKHSFQKKVFKKPAHCLWCKNFIWGMTAGHKCLECSGRVHKKCLKDATDKLPCNPMLKELHGSNQKKV